MTDVKDLLIPRGHFLHGCRLGAITEDAQTRSHIRERETPTRYLPAALTHSTTLFRRITNREIFFKRQTAKSPSHQ